MSHRKLFVTALLAFILTAAAAVAEPDCKKCLANGVCFPDQIDGWTVCTTSCCPNRCQNAGVHCLAPPPSSTSVQKKAEKATPVSNNEKLLVIKAEVR